MTVHEAVVLAAYVLAQAKEHVDGCGGDSHIAVLRHDRPSGLVRSNRVEQITRVLEALDSSIASILLASGNLSLDYDAIVEMSMDAAAESINVARKLARSSREFDDYLDGASFIAQALALPDGPERDDLGFLVKPSISDDPT